MLGSSSYESEESEQGVCKLESYKNSEFDGSATLFNSESVIMISSDNSDDVIEISSDPSNSDELTITSNCPRHYSKCVPKLPKVRKIESPTPLTFVSPIASWQRVFQKYSPSTETQFSPVKHISANIAPNVFLDEYNLGMVWVCGMSEQFYYDNGINMLQKYFYNENHLKMVLRLNSMLVDPVENLKNLVDVHILGSGSFGDVYRVKHKLMDQYYAVKFLKKSRNTHFTDHTDSLLSYLKEKNFLIQARKSPYVVQFISSATYPKVSGLFLFFEWCLCDLRKFVKLVSWKGYYEYITQGIWNNVDEGITDILVNVHKKYNLDILKTSLIYIFEIFCGLAFLADCNLVHQDLKPENIMISITLHLKIADFGLAYNTKFITRRSQIQLVDPSEIDRYESANYRPQLGGTSIYQDMELSYKQLHKKHPVALMSIMNDQDNFRGKLTHPKVVDSDFLNDLWACGIMTIELLFGGIHPFYSKYMFQSVRDEMGLFGIYPHDVLKTTYNVKNYTRYIFQGFLKYGGPYFRQLMYFVAVIFRPREVRAEKYIKYKQIYQYGHKVTLGQIDINKVEQIDIFRNLNLHSHNSFLYELPEELIELLAQDMSSEFPTMGDLLKSIVSEDDEQFFTLDPGIRQNFC